MTANTLPGLATPLTGRKRDERIVKVRIETIIVVLPTGSEEMGVLGVGRVFLLQYFPLVKI